MMHTLSITGRSRRRTWAGAFALLVLAGCAGLPGLPERITLSETQLAEKLAQVFPVQRRYLDLFDLQLSAPKLRLLPDQNRVHTTLNYRLGELWLGDKRLQGELALSYGLRFEPSDASVRMADVRVEQLDLSGLAALGGTGSALAPQVRRLGTWVAEQVLRDVTLYQVPPERMAQVRRLGLQPGALAVQAGGIELALQPLPR